jgi:hypothetical protein
LIEYPGERPQASDGLPRIADRRQAASPREGGERLQRVARIFDQSPVARFARGLQELIALFRLAGESGQSVLTEAEPQQRVRSGRVIRLTGDEITQVGNGAFELLLQLARGQGVVGSRRHRVQQAVGLQVGHEGQLTAAIR